VDFSTQVRFWALPVALLAALAALACAKSPISDSPTSPAGPPPSLEQRAAELLSQAIRIRSVNPPGDERPLAELLVSELSAAGLESALIETPRGASSIGRAAAWARLAGTGGRAPLVLLSHLDVVPVEPAAWEFDPFAGVLHDGFVVGRGALDAKGVAIVQLLVMTELARRGERLQRDLILLATPDEESGGRDGAGWLLREHPELLGGARYLLTEGGGVMRGPEGRPELWGVAVTEKSPCWLELVASGTAGHSSVPPADAAVPRLLAALERVRRIEPEVHVVPAVARMFEAMAPLAAPEDAPGFRDLANALDGDPAFRERFLGQRTQAALVRDTVAITVLEGSSRTNVVPGRARAQLDARLLPGRSCKSFARRLRAAIGDPGISVEELLSFPSSGSPPDTALFEAIRRVAAASDPGALVVPRVLAGFTDAHYFRELGIVAYGFVPRWLRLEEALRVHGPNERVSVENLGRGVEVLIEILKELDALGG
jgi:acetylornithine deacetylase/succinyl-diaminopimelate desuccinylase-like protein